MTGVVNVMLNQSETVQKVPTQQQFLDWSACAYQSNKPVEVSIQVVDINESTALNLQYRNKNRPTNVLSFPLHVPVDNNTELLGDLVICAPVVQREAAEQGKPENAHWAHMVVHGMLHLQGYDHELEGDAEIMEKLEIDVLKKLGFASPY